MSTSTHFLPNGLVRHNSGDLSTTEALSIYARDQLLWLRLSPEHQSVANTFNHHTIQSLFSADPTMFTHDFSVENACQHDPPTLTPAAVYGSKQTSSSTVYQSPFYVSSILQNNQVALHNFFHTVPFSSPNFLQQAYHDDGAWLFFAHNPATKHTDTTTTTTTTTTATSSINDHTITGRPEHVDDVTHSGTWHVQLNGTKTWYIRPCPAAADWNGNPPTLTKEMNGVYQGTALKGTRLKIKVEQGDLLVINTRAWYHQTEIEGQSISTPPSQASIISEEKTQKRRSKRRKTMTRTEQTQQEEDATFKKCLSISYARDFYLHGKEPSQDQTNKQQDQTAHKTNSTGLDPRLVAREYIFSGNVAVQEEDLPEDELIPRSMNSNCELCVCDIDGEESMVMLALRDIYVNEPFSVQIDESTENAADMEEWELNTTTGEMTRVVDMGD
jgi:hypothetical protein